MLELLKQRTVYILSVSITLLLVQENLFQFGRRWQILLTQQHLFSLYSTASTTTTDLHVSQNLLHGE